MRDPIDLALRIIKEGTPYRKVILGESRASGLWTSDYFGFRLGMAKVELSPWGDVYVVADKKRNEFGDPNIWLSVYSKAMGRTKAAARGQAVKVLLRQRQKAYYGRNDRRAL